MYAGMLGVVGRVAYIKIIHMNEKPNKGSLFSIPSNEKIPEYNSSLKMINTVNYIPNSCENIDMPMARVVFVGEDSLDKILNNTHTTYSAKKRRVGCTCKKTFCLKMYCECFSTGKICGDDCACTGCKNTPEFEEQIANAKTSIKQGGLRNCSLAEKRCNCKKSHCQKRYCECYNSGVSCTEACRCEGCENHGPSQQKQQSAQQQPLVVQQPQKREFPPLVYRSMEDLQHFIS